MNAPVSLEKKTSAAGIFYALLAFISWGFLPGYWKMLKSVPSDEIVFHRIVWTFLISVVLVTLTGRNEHFFKILKSRKLRIFVFLSSLTIVSNWLIYVYAVNSGRIVEASLGYFINPLVNIFLGMVVLKERLKPVQMTAILLAAVAVLYMAFDLGSFPWIALSLAFSFGFYGLIKKMGNLDSIASLAAETLFLFPVAASVVLFKEYNGTGAMGSSSLQIILLLAGTGVVSAVPLFWFAHGAKRIPLSSVGFIQYVSPSIMLLIGVLVYRESFTLTHKISFSLIWFALVLYTGSGLIKERRSVYSE